jgi:hypothetical protein
LAAGAVFDDQVLHPQQRRFGTQGRETAARHHATTAVFTASGCQQAN